MPMTKAEKARLAELETALALHWPAYPSPSPVTLDEVKAAPKVKVKSGWGGQRDAVPGFFFNANSSSITEGFSDGYSHSRWSDTSWSQNMGQMYRTRVEAAMAMRLEMSRDFAKKLAAVDRIIAEAPQS